ncbi:MAG: DUF2062 domain-containing protein [Thermodesulfobacteriota bacterium]|nr:DUF2062 domain-containing protein [Thermodesulfobacteriota bacterium]
MKKWLKKNLIKPERLRGEQIHRIVGDRLFDKDIWHINRRSIAGGLALGVFIAFTPTIPFQMLLSAICAIWMRVNLPIALAGCWVTNPLTAVWIYLMEYWLGRMIMEKLPWLFTLSDLENIGTFRKLFSQATYIWTGGLLIGSIAALVVYATVRILWYLVWGASPDDTPPQP